MEAPTVMPSAPSTSIRHSSGGASASSIFFRTLSANAASAMPEHQHEFITAETRHDIVLAHDGAQALADFDQREVAVLMAKLVVDCLEAVEVDEHDCELFKQLGGAATAFVYRGI